MNVLNVASNVGKLMLLLAHILLSGLKPVGSTHEKLHCLSESVWERLQETEALILSFAFTTSPDASLTRSCYLTSLCIAALVMQTSRAFHCSLWQSS